MILPVVWLLVVCNLVMYMLVFAVLPFGSGVLMKSINFKESSKADIKGLIGKVEKKQLQSLFPLTIKVGSVLKMNRHSSLSTIALVFYLTGKLCIA